MINIWWFVGACAVFLVILFIEFMQNRNLCYKYNDVIEIYNDLVEDYKDAARFAGYMKLRYGEPTAYEYDNLVGTIYETKEQDGTATEDTSV